MKGTLFILVTLLLATGLSAQVLSCYDVQHTTNASGDSPYAGQTVTVQGVVSAIKPNSALFICDLAGGPWSGLYIYHRNTSNTVSVGDMVVLNGGVVEYNGMTEMSTVNSVEILSSGNPLPAPVELTTAQIPYNSVAVSEQWESVLVRISDVQVKTTVDSYGQFKVANTGSASQSMVDDGLFSYAASSIIVGDQWYLIQGIVDHLSYSSAGFKINPRNANDMIKVDNVDSSIITISYVDASINTLTKVPLTTTKVKTQWGVQSYTATIKIDPLKVHFQGLDHVGTLTTEAPVPVVSANGDTISFSVMYQEMLVAAEGDTLINLVLEPLVYGEALIDLLSFKYDNVNIINLNDGSLNTRILSNIAYLNISNAMNNKNIFNPSANEKINITYGCQSGQLGKALVRIYDAQGRLVATPVNDNLPNAGATLSLATYEWNGRDANLNLLAPGLYYCHLEVQDRRTGKSERTVQPIVIKSRLK